MNEQILLAEIIAGGLRKIRGDMNCDLKDGQILDFCHREEGGFRMENDIDQGHRSKNEDGTERETTRSSIGLKGLRRLWF